MISRRRWRARSRAAAPIVALTILNIVAVVLLAGPVVAKGLNYGGGLAQAIADALYCKLAGCTMSGTVTFSGVATDITTVGNEDLTLAPGGTGSVVVKSGDDATEIRDAAGNLDANLKTGTGANTGTRITGAGAVHGLCGAESNVGVCGAEGNVDGASFVFIIADTYTDSSSRTILGGVTGTGGIVATPGSALTISGTPDTTSAPANAGTACRFSAASAGQSWTPAESNALNGVSACCTNTGANSVTITASAGVFEGGGGAVAQWKTICMDYVTDRWVQRGSISP